MTTAPPIWTSKQISESAKKAVTIFRRERLDEPLALYNKFFEMFAQEFVKLIPRLPDILGSKFSSSDMVSIFQSKNKSIAFRYLAAPPISEDDLETLAETTLSAKSLASDIETARRVRDTVLHVIDGHRFPWITGRKKPTEQQLNTAIIASATIAAAQRVAALRRNKEKEDQENLVKKKLRDLGFKEMKSGKISTLNQAPTAGQFCPESLFGSRKADIIVGLFDGRTMPIECKVSNSKVNSIKRINNDAAVKAKTWISEFGRRNIVPTAMLSGVFNPPSLEAAQGDGLSLFWAHDLDMLAKFILAAGSASA